jgi:hypothetical protein
MISGVSLVSSTILTPNDDPHVSETLTDTIIYWLKQQCETVGIEPDIAEYHDINIFPNPFTESISISMPDDKLNGTLIVYNALGQIVSKADKIDFSKWRLLLI